MAGIWGDGQRGGIFGARVDPRLQAELEKRAASRQAYETPLSPMQELKFRDWKQRFAPQDSGEDYDLRGAFKAGFQPDPETGHWPDVYKKPNHPTFSDQSIYARDKPELAGTWDGDTYVPSPLRQQMDAEAESQPTEQSTIGSRAQNWWNNTTFFKPAWDDLVGGLTAPGDVMAGAQPTMAADPQTGEFHTDPRLADRAMNAAGMLTLGAGTIPAEANSLRMGIKAYHGSPHDFERFDSSKIGTGEGAQAYGHGLYLAENEAVAKQYRDLLGTRSSAVGDPVARAQFWASDLGSREAAITHLEGVLRQAESRPKNFDAADLEKSRQAIDYLKSGGDLMPKSGHMYQVDIAAEPEHFLDWDKPLAEQSPQVRRGYAQAVAGGDPIASELLDESPESLQMAGLFPKSSGAQAYNTLARSRQRDVSPKNAPLASPQQQKGWDVLASQALREAGVPGIRYLDQGSRGQAMYDVGSPRADFGPYTPFRNRADAEAHQAMLKRQGFDDAEIKERAEKQTSNFVIFPGNERLIAILKKYGLPISAAGLAALSQLHPQEAQAAQQKPLRIELNAGERDRMMKKKGKR